MSIRQRLFAYVVTVLVTVSSLGITAQPAKAAPVAASDDEVIVANDDRFTLWAGSGMTYMPVEKNDERSDPMAPIAVADIRKITKGKDGVSIVDHGIQLKMPKSRKTDIIFEYRLKNFDTDVFSNWATVTIKVKPIKEIKVKQPRPGRLKLINPNTGTTRCRWGTLDGAADTHDGTKRIKAESSEVVKIHRTKLYLRCSIGKYGATTANRMLRNLK